MLYSTKVGHICSSSTEVLCNYSQLQGCIDAADENSGGFPCLSRCCRLEANIITKWFVLHDLLYEHV